MRAAQQRRARLVLARRSFRAYVLWMVPKFDMTPFHRSLCDHLQAVADGKITQLLIDAPPRHGKSLLVSELFPAWRLGCKPTLKVMGASHNQKLADKVSRRVKRWMNNPLHAELFGAPRFGDINQAREWGLLDGGEYNAFGAGAGTAGNPANVAIVDDPFGSRAEAESPAARARIVDWFSDDVQSRLEYPSAVIIMATRWHPEDLTGYVLKSSSAKSWTHLHFPAIQDRPATSYDMRAIGAPLWPGRYARRDKQGDIVPEAQAELVRRYLTAMKGKELESPRGFQSLYQGNPSVRAGTLFKREWFQTYTADPALVARSVDRLYISVDATFGSKTVDADEVAIMVVGVRNHHYYIIDELVAAMSYVETKQNLIMMASKWSGATILIEARANGTALIDDLRTKLARVVSWSPGSDSKHTRAQLYAETCEAKQFWLPSRAAWAMDYIEEHTGFTGERGGRDNRVDAVGQLVLYLNGSSSARSNLLRIVQGFGG